MTTTNKSYVSVWLDNGMLRRIDAVGTSPTGMQANRSESIRMLLERGLDTLGRCAAVKGDHVCTLHQGHAGSHYDSTANKAWK